MLLTERQREQRRIASEKLGWTTPQTGLRMYLSNEQKQKIAAWAKTGTGDHELIKAIKS